MWRTFPEYAEACKEIDDDLPTSRVPTSERHQNFRIGHMWHCRRCWQYSEVKCFRMAGVDSATRLLKDLRTSRPHAQLGARGVDERFTTGVHGEWGPIGTTGSPSIAGCIKTVENSRQRRRSTDLSVGHPTEQHTLPELLLADGRHELPRLCENSLGDGVPTPACNTGSGRRASLHRGARAELPQVVQAVTRRQPPDIARQASPGVHMGHRTPLHDPLTQSDMEAKQSEIENDIHVALEYVHRAS